MKVSTLPLSGRVINYLFILWVISAVIYTCVSVAQQGVEKSAALHAEGLKLYKEGRYEEALERFLDAYESFPEPTILFNIARCYEHMERYRDAVSYYEKFLKEPGAQKKDKARSYMESILKLPARIWINSKPESAQVFLDGRKEAEGKTPVVIEVQAGEHEIMVEKEGYVTQKRVIDVSYGEKYELNLLLVETPSADSGSREEVKKGREVSVGKEISPEQRHNLVALSCGISFPVSFKEANSFIEVALLWNHRIWRGLGAGIGGDLQLAGNGQIYSLYGFISYHLDINSAFYLYGLGGVGGSLMRISEEGALIVKRGLGGDFMFHGEVGAGIWIGGFVVRISAGALNFYAGAGDVIDGVAFQYATLLGVGYER